MPNRECGLWSRLSESMHQSTDSSLRRLKINFTRGLVVVSATAPTVEKREQALLAARRIVPQQMLVTDIQVETDVKDLSRTECGLSSCMKDNRMNQSIERN